jgi:putative FmdB family regulatory protein
MPVYTYKCNNCEHRFEVRQRFSDDPIKECPRCHVNGDVRRVISPVGVVFKGSGFYVTDNRGKSSTGRTNGSGTTRSLDEMKNESSKGDKRAAKSDSNTVPAGQSNS